MIYHNVSKKRILVVSLISLMLLLFGFNNVYANGDAHFEDFNYIDTSAEYIETKYGQRLYLWYWYNDPLEPNWSMPWGPGGAVITHKQAYLYEMKDVRQTDDKLITI